MRPRAPAASARSSSGDGCALGRGALLAKASQDAPPAVLLQAAVEAADLDEHLVGDGLLLLASRVLHALPANRLAVLDRHLGELQPLPVAHLRGAVDRDRDDRRPRLEREPSDAGL